MEFLKDYNINFYCHPGKANVVADALSHRQYSTFSCLLALPKNLCEDFRRLEINVAIRRDKPIICAMEVQLALIKKMQIAQGTKAQLERINEEVLVGKAPGFIIHEDGTLRF